jgi:hypothetical protein
MKILFKNVRFGLLLILYILSSDLMNAQIETSGFFDVAGIANLSDSKQSKFIINQFELDFSYLHKSHFSVGSALAYNNETGNIELPMAFIHYSFNEGPGKHPRRVETYDHSALLIGKFDMPFGLDYLSYASVDRPTFTQPLVIEKTIAGWNDIGVDFHLFAGKFKFDVWTVNGFRDGVGIGGNVRYQLFHFLEVGASHSSDVNNFKKVDDWLSGVDIKIDTEVFHIKSEFLWMKGVYEGIVDTVLNNEMHQGGYVQVLTDFEKWTSLPLSLTLRIGGWQCSDVSDEDFDDSQMRYTATVGYYLHENLSIRLEMAANTYNKGATETLGVAQIVVGF